MHQNTELVVLASAVALVPMQSEAQTFNYVGVEDAPRARIDMFYSADQLLGIRGYTFVELTAESHFSKTFLSRPVLGGLGPRVETTNASDFDDQIGFGVQYDFTVTKGLGGSLSFMPHWRDRDGKVDGDQRSKVQAGLFYSMKVADLLPDQGWAQKFEPKLEQFLNFDAHSAKPTYGEIEFSLKANGLPGLRFLPDGTRVGAHFDTLGNDSYVPEFHGGVLFSYVPGGD